MKKISHLITLLPCHSLEDFPVHGSKSVAQSLLTAWTGLWHPALIAAAGKAPRWRRADDTVSSDEEAEQHRESFIQQHYYDQEPDGSYDDQVELDFDAEAFASRWRDCLIAIPRSAKAIVFSGFTAAAREAGATIVDDFGSRSELLSSLDCELDDPSGLADDFFALAYVRLQVEMMTLKLRFSSELDIEGFDKVAVAAANASQAGDVELAKEKLQFAFDQLAEEKNRYYPVAADFVDMILVADSIRSESIDAELESDAPITFAMSGSTVRSLADRAPATVAAIAARIQEGSVCLVGGQENELPDNLLSVESMLNQLILGQATMAELLGDETGVFMRRRFGLNASLPGILDGLKFLGAMHVLLDQGSIPTSSSNSMRWMGSDGGAVMAISQSPLDSACDKSFLDLGVRIGSELDSAHISNVFFARWPTQTCDSFQDLRNSTNYGNVLGDFTSADSWFENAYDPGYGDAFEAEEYESPWLAQAVASGSSRPISTFVRYWESWYKLAAARSLIAMKLLSNASQDLSDAVARSDQFQNQIELQTLDWNSAGDDSIAAELELFCSELAESFDGSLINTVLWRQRAHVMFDGQSKGSGVVHDRGAIKHAAQDSGRCDAIVELSGFGELLVNPQDAIESSRKLNEPLIDDGESILRNEFFEVRLDRESGGIRGVYFYGKRGNLLSQKLAVRYLDSVNKEVHYSQMVCESFEVVTLSPIASQIRTSGKMIDSDGKVLAAFKQTVGLQRGRSVIDVDVEITEQTPLDGSSKNYIANRIAWSEDSAEMYCDMQGARHAIRRPSIEAPHYVEVVQSENRFALLTHGLVWHQRASKKVLDSILVVGNESRVRFHFGIAVNSDAPMQLAVAEMHPVVLGNQRALKSGDEADSKWLLHLANRNVIATSCRPVFDPDCRCSGMRLRLQEVGGSGGLLKLYCNRGVVSARKESFDDQRTQQIVIDDQEDAKLPVLIETSFAAYEFFSVAP